MTLAASETPLHSRARYVMVWANRSTNGEEVMATYYAKVRVAGTSTAQLVNVEARGLIEARKLIEARFGRIHSYMGGPVSANKPPNWYR